MLERFPLYYERFACVAGDCPDNCCVGWDVVVDDEAAVRYAALDSALGEQLRAAMVIDDDGDRVFAEMDGRCPMLRPDGLCQIQRELGHEALCAVCRAYPRLRQDYGSFVEHGLALSCPVAAELILSSDNDGWLERETPGGEAADYDPALMALLQQTRPPLMALLRDAHRPVGDCLALALCYAWAVQDALEGEELLFDPDAELASLPAPVRRSMAPLVDFHRGLEILTPRWRAMLDTLPTEPPAAWPTETRALASYYVNRYWLQAVSDRDVIWRVKQMIGACLMARLLPDRAAMALYSKEVEHDGGNVDCIWEAVDTDPAWTDRLLLDWLRG